MHSKNEKSELAQRIPLAKIKLNFSRYVRDVQTHGRSLTITQHGRDAAILAPLSSTPRLTLTIRPALDQRPLGALDVRPLRGHGASSRAIARAIDDERGE